MTRTLRRAPRRELSWRASKHEQHMTLPGDDLLPQGRPSTHAVHIAAPPERVWPWLVQIGRARGGFYTYTWIENLLGADIHNLDHLDPDLQHLVPGDCIWLTPERYLGQPGQFWRVRHVVPGRALVLEQCPPDNPTTGTWSLVVLPDASGTRLLSRHRSMPPSTLPLRLWAMVMELGNAIMERGMLRGIARRVQNSNIETTRKNTHP
jgi:hypothetical protein